MTESHLVEFVVSRDWTDRAIAAYFASKDIKPPSKLIVRLHVAGLGAASLGICLFGAVYEFNWCGALQGLVVAMWGFGLHLHVQAARIARATIADHLNKFDSTQVQLTLTPDGIFSKTIEGDSFQRWTEFRDIFQRHGLWVMKVGGTTIFLPPDRFGRGGEEFFLTHARAAGARIRIPSAVELDYDDELG